MPTDDDKPVSPHAPTVGASAEEDHESDQLVGAKLGHYRVVRRLGKGGMGVVYRAEDEKLRRAVALKVLPDTSGDDEKRQRFLREARSAAAITHPNVAVVHQVDEADGRIFIAMELVSGESLRERLSRGRLDVAKAKSLATQIARGLAAAHEQGIVHRDLKPENVMITPAGVVKLLDFGLAKGGVVPAAAGASDASVAKTETLVTADEGRIMGTPEYMSPEQAMGDPLDVRSDVFSFGVVLYEMLAGSRPFAGRTTGAVLMAVARDPVLPVRAKAPDVDEATAALVAKCLAKAPAARFANAGEVVTALEASSALVVGELPITQIPRRRSRYPGVGLASLLAATLAASFIGVRLAERPAPGPRASAASATETLRPTAVTDLPPPKTSSEEAGREYATAMQYFRDASLQQMRTHLKRALEIDPYFAAAHLRLSINYQGTDWSMADARAHCAVATTRRRDLDDRDRELLDIVRTAIVGDSIDLEDGWRRIDALEAHLPFDADLALLAGIVAVYTGRTAEGGALVDRASALDPEFAMPACFRGFSMMLGAIAGGDEGALASLDSCLTLSPTATTCIEYHADLEKRLGDCSALEKDARTMIHIAPEESTPYEWLSAALIAKGESPESIAEADQRARRHADPKTKARSDLGASIDEAILVGDFTAAMAAFPALDRSLAEETSSLEAGQFDVEFIVYYETGQLDRAVATADAFMKRRPALSQDDLGFDARRLVLMAKRLAGRMPDDEFAQKREAWAKEARAKFTPVLANQIWLDFYARTAFLPEDARSALEALPEWSPLPPFDNDVAQLRGMGWTQFLAGHVDDAIPYLRRAAKACVGLDNIFTHVLAAEELGEALESKGDAAGACAQFADVQKRWGHAKPRSVTAEKARARAAKLHCAADAAAPSPTDARQ